MSLSRSECESILSDVERELLEMVEETARWLRDSSEEKIIITIRENLGYYRAVGCDDYTTKREIDGAIRFYLKTKKRLDSCNGDDEKWQDIIQELFAFEFELQKSSSKKEERFATLKKCYSPNGVEVDEQALEGHITAIRDSNQGEKSYLEYIRGEVLSNFGEFFEQTAVFTFGWGILTLVIPAAFCKGILNGLITSSIFIATFSVLKAYGYHSLWKDLLVKNEEAVRLFKILGIYDDVLKYLAELNTYEELKRRSILRHVKS